MMTMTPEEVNEIEKAIYYGRSDEHILKECPNLTPTKLDEIKAMFTPDKFTKQEAKINVEPEIQTS